MDLWFYSQKYEKFSKKRLSRLLIRCRPAVPLRIAGHPRFRPCAGSPSRSAVSSRRAGPPRCRAERVPGRSENGPAIVRYGGAIRGRNVRFPRFCRVFGGSRRRPESPGESIFWPRVVFFRRKTVSSRRGIVIRRMLLRIQYALFVLLFVLLSAVVPASDGMRVRDEACATLCEQHVVPVPAPARFCFATVCSLPDMAGLPDAAGGSKSPVRIPADVRPSACVAAAFGTPVALHGPEVRFRTVDYYVFSLGHILI